LSCAKAIRWAFRRADERLVEIVNKVKHGELEQDRRHIIEKRLN
jgi:hypothetical protein